MKAGDVVLIPLPQPGGGAPKLRPALVLTGLPGPYQDLLLCGISTQLQLLVPDWDELIASDDADFPRSGLRRASAIRLSYLYAAHTPDLVGVIGAIEPDRLQRLRSRLAARLI